jgi:hypothetical protein
MATQENAYNQFLAKSESLAKEINPYKYPDDPQKDLNESVFRHMADHEESMAVAFGAGRSAVEKYKETYGEDPSIGQLSCAHQAIKNVMEGKIGAVGNGEIILEAAETTSNDIPIRNIFMGMVLPATLMSISSRLTTPFPSEPDKAEIYRLYTRSASNWNGFSDGDLIDESFAGGFGNMDIMQSMGTGDGSTTSWTHTVGFACQKNRVQIFVDMDLLGTDDGSGNINGTLTVNGSTISCVSSTVNYATGAVSLQTSGAVPSGLEIEVKVHADIEADPTLIPKIKYDTQRWEVQPFDSVIGSQYSLQAMLNLQRNFGQSLATLASRHLLNIVTTNLDRVIIADMWKQAKGKFTFDAQLPAGLSQDQHFPTVGIVLDQVNHDLITRNRQAGLFALVCGTKASAFFRSMARMGVVQMAPNYRTVPQPHFIGRYAPLGIELYEDPNLPTNEALAIAKGDSYMLSGYYSSTAIPFMPFRHSVEQDLRYKNTLYGRHYRSVAPITGREFFTKFEVLNF